MRTLIYIPVAFALLGACSQPADTGVEEPTLVPDPPRSVESFSETEILGEGLVIAGQLCSGCHAVGADGESPHADAPPFRTLSERFPVENLAEPLAEGIMVGHPDMPVFQFEAREVEALVTYIESVQTKAD